MAGLFSRNEQIKDVLVLFFKDILDVNLDRPGRGAEPLGDLLVAEPVRDEPEHFGFAGRQRHLGEVFAEPSGDFCGHQPFAGVDRADRVEDVRMDGLLQ